MTAALSAAQSAAPGDARPSLLHPEVPIQRPQDDFRI